EGLAWEQASMNLVGLADEMDMEMAQEREGDGGNLLLANRALAFVAKSVCAKWKHFVAYYTYRIASGFRLFEAIQEVVEALHGEDPADMPVFIMNRFTGRKMFILSDFPHLMKVSPATTVLSFAMSAAVLRLKDRSCHEYVQGTAAYLKACATLWDAFFDGKKLMIDSDWQSLLGRIEAALAWFSYWYQDCRKVRQLFIPITTYMDMHLATRGFVGFVREFFAQFPETKFYLRGKDFTSNDAEHEFSELRSAGGPNRNPNALQLAE
ncbi:hypothetical protein COCSUDRAFT_40352, partial [Coccomyxa subellipsoidea C-169]